MKEKLIEILKLLELFPKSGFGEITIKINAYDIVHVVKTESKKIK